MIKFRSELPCTYAVVVSNSVDKLSSNIAIQHFRLSLMVGSSPHPPRLDTSLRVVGNHDHESKTGVNWIRSQLIKYGREVSACKSMPEDRDRHCESEVPTVLPCICVVLYNRYGPVDSLLYQVNEAAPDSASL